MQNCKRAAVICNELPLLKELLLYRNNKVVYYFCQHHVDEEELANFLQDFFEFLGEEWVDRNFALALE